MINWSHARYSKDDGGWILNVPTRSIANHVGNEVQVIVAGASDAVDPTRFPIIEVAVVQHADLIHRARDYILAIVHPTKVNGSTGDVILISMEFGTWQDAKEDEVQLWLGMHKDDYGTWFVRFSYDARQGRFWPVAFGRES